MIEVAETEVFSDWLGSLRDSGGRRRILARINRVRHGNLGERRENIAPGVSELIFKGHGPGYRIYYARRGKVLVLLLCGGDKSTQQADIRVAECLANEV